MEMVYVDNSLERGKFPVWDFETWPCYITRNPAGFKLVHSPAPPMLGSASLSYSLSVLSKKVPEKWT